MHESTSRRRFLACSTSSLALAGGFEFLSRLPRVSAEEARQAGNLAPLHRDLEPLVRLIEDTSREQLLERVAERIRSGASYREVLGALLLAGVRNVQPRPAVGFKFHCVLVVNSCHLASLNGPDSDRWLPIFWALDYFKSSQADEVRRGGWRMAPVQESKVPDAARAAPMFVEAMETWDEEKADVATAGLVRTAGANQVFELFARYAARDFRSIGHKAIYLANAWRTLQVIGWELAEPVMRSLAFALLNHNDEPNPANSDLAPDRDWRQHESRLEKFPENWLSGRADEGVAKALLEAFRKEGASAAAELAVESLAGGAGPQSIWDGVFVGAGELLMRQPGIIGLHGLTTANAMRFLWEHASDDATRRRLLLQACAFNPMFRESAKSRGALSDTTIDALQAVSPDGAGDTAIEEILADVTHNKSRAAGKVRGFLESGGDAHTLIQAARRVLFLKGSDAHDYKFASAVLEDYQHVSSPWREQFFATAVFNLKGSGHPDSGLLGRTKAALNG
ncbi:MAG: hypothetical protein KDB14_23885 [Planctomycetales bacterium]|nr:hypothetical protein [Planctomycetales bacterium]